MQIVETARARGRGRWRWAAGGAAALVLALLMACVVGRAAIERGRVPPPEITVDLAVVRLLTVVTDTPNCWRPVHGSASILCSSGSILNPDRYYIGWLEVRPASRSRQPIYRKIFVLRLPSA